ncbi:unnamed protein product [Prorocentrum cordatum]|uniref:Glycerophosphocholine acyltransferase 1 n=1 Tax=Prorocentrum cordatum TaxID=2364126 RepID=A0ABN9RR91_9DINO|nr:unnamed protein product [Polarella glacialis]
MPNYDENAFTDLEEARALIKKQVDSFGASPIFGFTKWKFFLGVAKTYLSLYICGRWPGHYWKWHVLQFWALLPIHSYRWWKMKQLLYFAELCWVMNATMCTVLPVWYFNRNYFGPEFFDHLCSTIFGFAAGPLAIAAYTIFHSTFFLSCGLSLRKYGHRSSPADQLAPKRPTMFSNLFGTLESGGSDTMRYLKYEMWMYSSTALASVCTYPLYRFGGERFHFAQCVAVFASAIWNGAGWYAYNFRKLTAVLDDMIEQKKGPALAMAGHLLGLSLMQGDFVDGVVRSAVSGLIGQLKREYQKETQRELQAAHEGAPAQRHPPLAEPAESASAARAAAARPPAPALRAAAAPGGAEMHGRALVIPEPPPSAPPAIVEPPGPEGLEPLSLLPPASQGHSRRREGSDGVVRMPSGPAMPGVPEEAASDEEAAGANRRAKKAFPPVVPGDGPAGTEVATQGRSLSGPGRAIYDFGFQENDVPQGNDMDITVILAGAEDARAVDEQERCDAPQVAARPMVSPGYTDPAASADVYAWEAGASWYRTRDCVEEKPAGYAFAGRADARFKVAGAWADARELQGALEAVPGVREAHVCSPAAAFVALDSLDGDPVPALRRALPPGFSLLLATAFPRLPGSGKVDSRRLRDLAAHRASPAEEVAEEQQRLPPR